MTVIIIWIILIVLAALLLWTIITNKLSGGGGNFAATSVFTDMQNREKRNAMETVIEEKAGKKQFDQTKGEPEKKTGPEMH